MEKSWPRVSYQEIKINEISDFKSFILKENDVNVTVRLSTIDKTHTI